MYELTAEEKETQINWNNAEKEAHIYTYDQRIIKKLSLLGIEVKVDKSGLVAAKIPKKWVKIQKPRELTDEEKRIASERMKELRKRLGQ